MGAAAIVLAWAAYFVTAGRSAVSTDRATADRQSSGSPSSAQALTENQSVADRRDEVAGATAMRAVVESPAREADAATSAEQRRHAFWLTIRDAGHDCEEVLDAQPLGAEASSWRVHCGGTSVYWVEIDETGRYLAEPAPYGDIEPTVPGLRTLELDESR